MRRVVEASEVAHLWANQIQEDARTPTGNMFFRGNTIYSYGRHFPIAKFIEHEGKNAILFTLDTYSNTTAKHIGHVRGACSHKFKVYCQSINFSHSQNFDSWNTEASYVTEAFKKAKKPEIYIRKLQNIANYVHKYAEFFGINVPEELIKQLSIRTQGESKEYYIELEKRVAEQRKLAVEKSIKDAKQEIKKWRSFDINRCYKQLSYGETYLRVFKYAGLIDTDTSKPKAASKIMVQTSKGVEIPKDIALRFYNNFKKGLLKVDDKILNYRVDFVSKKMIRIGCHNLTSKELTACYKQLILK